MELRLDPLHHLMSDVAVMLLAEPACEVASGIINSVRELGEELAARVTDRTDLLSTEEVAQPVVEDLVKPATERTGMPAGLEGRCFQGQSGEGLLDEVVGIDLLEVLAAQPAV